MKLTCINRTYIAKHYRTYISKYFLGVFMKKILTTIITLNAVITLNSLEAMEISHYTPRPPAREFAYHPCIPTLQTLAITAATIEQLETLLQPTVRDYTISFKRHSEKTNPIEKLKLLNSKKSVENMFLFLGLNLGNFNKLEHILTHTEFTQQALDNLLLDADNNGYTNAAHLLVQWYAKGAFFERWKKPSHKAIVEHAFYGTPLFFKEHAGIKYLYTSTKDSQEEICLDIINEATVNATENELTAHIRAGQFKPYRIATSTYERTILHLAAKYNLITITNELLPFASKDNENKALFLATRHVSEAVLLRLIQNGANVNAKDENGNTPLHIAVQKNLYTITQLLIDKHANVNAKNKYGNTPLHETSPYEYHDMAQLLIQHGANVNNRDIKGDTLLHVAAYSYDFNNNYFEVAQFLLKNGADLNKKNRDRKTPLDIALERKNTSMITLLKQADANQHQRSCIIQ